MVGQVMMFSLFDRKAREYGPPLVAANVETMVREIKRNVADGSLISRYPEDFDLYLIATMDTEAGVVTGETPTCVALLSEVLNGKPQDG